MSCGLCCQTAEGDVTVELVALDGEVQTAFVGEKHPTLIDAGASEKDDEAIFGKTLSKVGGGSCTVSAAAADNIKKCFVARLMIVQGKSPGIECDVSKSPFLRVNKVEQYGPVPIWNEQALIDEHIREGDFLMRVGTEVGDAQSMLLALYQAGSLDVIVRRPRQFTVEGLHANSSGLGITITSHPRSTCLVVTEVLPSGAVSKWNQGAPEDSKVSAGDHILSVNGRATIQDMQQLLVEGNNFSYIEIVRPDMS